MEVLLRLLVCLGATLASRRECYMDDDLTPRRCSPPFHNIAHQRVVDASNTCGMDGPETYYRQVQSSQSASSASQYNSRSLRYVCDDKDIRRQHGAEFLTDKEAHTTWWQSQTLDAADLQYPNNVTLTVHLGKSYEITYVRLHFYSPRPESMIIEKRTCATCPWVKYQYYSNTCRETFGKPDTVWLQYENEPICESKMSKISPLSGGEIVFATLEGRPSNADFENSAILQEFVTATDIRITLVRLNTFGDEIFRGTKVLQSYYYAISDLVVGGKIKCNGHASDHSVVEGQVKCNCHHNTAGDDCERCLPLFNNRPWSRATSRHAQECEKCNCNNLADSCVYDPTVGQGRCIDCQRNTDGLHCELCKPGFYRDRDSGECIPCGCDTNGSQSAQCDENGQCQCHHGVEGDKCDHCQPRFYNLGRGGCQPCNCRMAGSLDNTASCDPITGECACKLNVQGRQCTECRVATMGAENGYGVIGPDLDNPYGCVPCFCFGHSNTCSPASHMVKDEVKATFDYDDEGWAGQGSQLVRYNNVLGQIVSNDSFSFPEKYLGNQRYSYNQHLTFNMGIGEQQRGEELVYPGGVKLKLIGRDRNGQIVSLETSLMTGDNPSPKRQLQKYSFRIHERHFVPSLEPVAFISVLNDLVSVSLSLDSHLPYRLDNVALGTARVGIPGQDGPPANHVETCGTGNARSSDGASCQSGYTFGSGSADPYQPCERCQCNRHARHPCDPITGECRCEHNTCGAHCDTCCVGFFGEPHQGTAADCAPCPCPSQGACTATSVAPTQLDQIKATCVDCPEGSTGPRCEQCLDNFFGDPLGLEGSRSPCQACQCSGNTNLLQPGNCDRVTGVCLKCLHHTEGDHCQRCESGYHGDPAAAAHEQPHGKGCILCECDKKGTKPNSVCNPRTGQCDCLPGVVGPNCDQCGPQHFGLEAGKGCRRCDCDPVGSEDGECDVATGQCQCKPGVTGRRCDQCQPGHYAFSISGCSECNCAQPGSTSLQCHLTTGQCPCREGVMGLRCDQCQENYFYDQDIYQCQRCHKCYDLVQYSVNHHRIELKRLVDLKNDILSNPDDFVDDAEFERQIALLTSESHSISRDAHQTLADFRLFEETLVDSGSSMDQVQLQLSQFASSLETCERTVSQARVYQKATDGTIHVVTQLMVEIGINLEDARDQLEHAESLAQAQNARHEELRSLYTRAEGILDKHRSESESVQEAAAQALETSTRAREQITDSLDLIKELKMKLTRISNNDVKSTKERILTLREAAKKALEAARKANDRALRIETNVPTSIPEFTDQSKEQISKTAHDITETANSINDKLNVLHERLRERYKSLGEKEMIAQDLYKEGKDLQDQADRLMAQVHAANTDVYNTNDNIREILDKARYVIETIQNLPQNVRNKEESGSNGEEFDLGEIKSDLKKLKDQMDPLRSDVEQSVQESQAKFDKMASSLRTAHEIDEANAEGVDNAIKLKIDIDAAVEAARERVQSMDNDQNGVDRRVEEVESLYSRSEKQLGLAKDALHKVTASSDYLELIRDHLQDIQDRDLLKVAQTLQDDRVFADQQDALADAEDKYNALKAAFDKFKDEHNETYQNYVDEINQREGMLAKYSSEYTKLAEQVANLEDIHKTLPVWCSSSAGNTAESSRQGSRGNDISEQP